MTSVLIGGRSLWRRHRRGALAKNLVDDTRTALQPWNADTGRGFLLAFRQEAANATQTIALRGVPAPGSFSLTLEDPATGTSSPLGVVDADTLRAGIDVTIPNQYGYAVIRIEPST